MAFLFALAPANAWARDRHILWAVQGQHNTVYLLGSVHVLRPQDAVLPEVMERAYRESERLVMEIDLDDPGVADPQAMLEDVQRTAVLPEGQTLRRVLGGDYAQIAAAAQQAGLDLELVDQFAPWFVAMTVLELELAKRGFSSEYGVEQTLAARAGRDHKPIAGLETPAQQFRLLAGMPLPMQKRFLAMTLAESQGLDQELGELLRAWQAGDTRALARLLSAEFDEFPDLYRTLTVDRNRAWVAQLTDLLDDREDYLVVVGALHLVGPDSVVALLEQRGFKVEQE
ncbi:MAG TPA: TraB/GumN family protein [Steroidobacteraceae bacterium]